jgi:hypothetical protein
VTITEEERVYVLHGQLEKVVGDGDMLPSISRVENEKRQGVRRVYRYESTH